MLYQTYKFSFVAYIVRIFVLLLLLYYVKYGWDKKG